jgi:hypothetical protein
MIALIWFGLMGIAISIIWFSVNFQGTKHIVALLPSGLSFLPTPVSDYVGTNAHC